jgi:hypothetical protein
MLHPNWEGEINNKIGAADWSMLQSYCTFVFLLGVPKKTEINRNILEL